MRDRLVVRTEYPEKLRAEFGKRCTAGENGCLFIQLASPEEKQSAMKHITDSYDIDEIRVFEPSLNDIFVEYASEAANKEDM